MEGFLDLLLADSAADDRHFRATALRADSGVRVREAPDGRSAITSLTRGSYHALICAEELPDLKATALARMVRAGVCGHPGIPIIILTDAPEVHALASADRNTYFLSGEVTEDFAVQALGIVRGTPKSSLLLVEDDPTHAETTAAMLAPYYRVEQARTGTAALDAWRARHHDVILLDLMLPEMPGEEVQNRVMSEDPDQIIVVLTANSDPEKHPAMVLGGAAAFLRKPVDLMSVMVTIDAIERDRQCRVIRGAATAAEEQLHVMATRMHAARYSLSRGQAGVAAQHLQRALTKSAVIGPSDDEWAMLLSEFE